VKPEPKLRWVIVGLPHAPAPSVPALIQARAHGTAVPWDGGWWKIVDLLGPQPPERLHTVALLEQVEGPADA